MKSTSYPQSSLQQDRGDLILHYETPTDKNLQEVRSILAETAFFDDLVAELNSTYVFPQDIEIVFDQCGAENAYYDPDTVEIIMCYDLS